MIGACIKEKIINDRYCLSCIITTFINIKIKYVKKRRIKAADTRAHARVL